MSSEGKVSQSSRRVIWRSLEDKNDPSRTQEAASGSDIVKQHLASEELFQLNRRKFLTLSGAITTLAGVEGCIRRPVENIMPYTDMPEYANIGTPQHYASVLNAGGEAVGILATSHDGRPTKIEGNPDHPTSRGATDMFMQSTILDLYDPERLQRPSQQGKRSDFAAFDKFLTDKLSAFKARAGAGLFFLAQPSNSPTYLRIRQLLADRLPLSRVMVFTPTPQGSNAREGARLALGTLANPVYDYSRAQVVLALDSDFLGNDAGSVLASRQFASARDVKSPTGTMNRLYSVEPTLSVTGSNADHRLRLGGQDVARYLNALSAELAANGLALGPLTAALRGPGAATDGIPASWTKVVARELLQHRGQSAIVVGPRQPAAVHALAYAVNRALGNIGTTLSFTEAVDTREAESFDSLKNLVTQMNAGKVDTLILLGGNPVYDAPADLKFADALKKVPTSVHFTSHLDETAQLCTWQVPRAHELESWGDQQSTLGDYSVQQPMIAPLWGGRTDAEVLAFAAGEANWRAYSLVQTTVEDRGIHGELAWRKLLHAGLADTRFAGKVNASFRDADIAAALQKLGAPAALAEGTFEAVFVADNKLGDGRSANNSWLLELPDPITRITWDNAALFAPSAAKSLGIKNGDMVRITHGDRSVDIVAWAQPGTATQSVILPLGWGRAAAGKNGNGHGFDVYPLRTQANPHFLPGVTVSKLGKRYPLSQTQEHDVMENRPLAVEATLAEYKDKPNFPEYKTPDPQFAPLWEQQDYSHGEQWGMTIDLNTCTGCSACVIACQAENNIPVVGKDQVARGREMAWLRIDRYYAGEEDEPDVVFQPVACQHCETAPCENVCPVAATSHSPEGLNDIAYNRCIGTRYCMNNCPYKVRRFNFLNYNLDVPETRQMQFNPSVSVRFRGVIEKCSYCVQRIEGAKIRARREGRVTVRDSDIDVACSQACASGAITFGNINDPSSAVSKARARDRSYGLLAEVGTRPRTRFLGKIRNPNPEMVKVKA